LNELQAACEDGNYAGFKECKATVNYGKKHGGWTINLGARSGEKYIRIYDKFAESKGKINSVRFEAEISGKLSDKLFSMLLEFPEKEVEYQQELINYCVGTISFIEKLDKNIARNLPLKWWGDWLEYLNSCPKKLHVRRFKTSINAKKRWIERAVSKSLALLKDALGQVEMKRYMDLIIREASERYKLYDLMILQDYRDVNTYIGLGYDIVAT
jgi:DNA relaxase NicK